MEKCELLSSLDSIREELMKNSFAVIDYSNLDDDNAAAILEIVFAVHDTFQGFSDALSRYMES